MYSEVEVSASGFFALASISQYPYHHRKMIHRIERLLINGVNLRLCRGLPEFDISGNIRKHPACEPLRVYKEESFRMDGHQSLSHEVWDCK
jgi:hypothetical protein